MNKEYYRLLKRYKYQLSKQQYRTFKGQINAGDTKGFMKGFYKIIMAKRGVN